MKNSSLFLAFLILFTALMITPATAQLVGADTVPGSSCTDFPNGATRMTADANNDRRQVILVCNGTTWEAERPSFVNQASCTNNAPVTFDAVTGGLRCGAADTVAPVWITPAGTIATTNVNLTISQAVAASDENGAPTYQKISGATWLSVSTAGTVSGKAPLAGGSYSIVIRASDAAGNTADRTFNVLVNSGSGPAGCTNPGDICPDLTIYVGQSPDDNTNYFTTQNSMPSLFQWNDGSASAFDAAITNCTNVESTCRTGKSNTEALMLADSAGTTPGIDPHKAARACYCLGEEHGNRPNTDVPSICIGDPEGTNTLNGFGYDDWYLPSIAELDVMFVNLVSPGDLDNPTYQDGVGGGNISSVARDGPASGTFTAGQYWSSSEYNGNHAWRLSFTEGFYFYNGKNNFLNVRCVRK